MNEIMMRIILSLCVMWLFTITVASCVWVLACIFRAQIDLMKVINVLPHRPVTSGQILLALNRVSFGRHVRAHAFLRDPWKLYDPIVRDAIENPHTEVISAQMMASDDQPDRSTMQ